MKSHNLYVVIFTNDNETFAKIGETSKSLHERFITEKNYWIKDYVQFEVYPKEDISASIIAKGIETDIIQNIIWKNNKLYRPQMNFNGYSECFVPEYFPIVVKYIKNNYNFKHTYSTITPTIQATTYRTLADYFKGTTVTTTDDAIVYFLNC